MTSSAISTNTFHFLLMVVGLMQLERDLDVAAIRAVDAFHLSTGAREGIDECFGIAELQSQSCLRTNDLIHASIGIDIICFKLSACWAREISAIPKDVMRLIGKYLVRVACCYAGVPLGEKAAPQGFSLNKSVSKYRNAGIQIVQGIEEPTQMLFIVLLSLLFRSK
jgi:hypothetical protein